jgi:hypothetical protein
MSPSLPVVHQPLGQCQGRGAAVAEAAHRGDALLRRGRGEDGHPFRLLHGISEGFLAQHMLAGLEGGDRNLSVGVTGGADVDQVDVVAFDQAAPVRLHRLPAQLVRGGPHAVGVPSGHSRELRLQRQVKEPGRGAPGVGVGGTHKGIAHHADAKGLDSVIESSFRVVTC